MAEALPVMSLLQEAAANVIKHAQTRHLVLAAGSEVMRELAVSHSPSGVRQGMGMPD